MKTFLALLCSAACIYGQNITGSIVGSVTDSSGSVIPGATITIRNQDTGLSTEAPVDQSGTYSVPNLQAGTYHIEARKTGFQSVDIRDVQLLAAQTVRQNITLAIGAVQQTVEIAGEAPLVRTDTQAIGSSLGSRQVADLPLPARSIDGLIALAPGVETGGGNPRISGSSYWGGNNFTLNGVGVNDSANSSAAYTSTITNLGEANMPAPDSLQEFKIDSSQNAEYRNVTTISMVTKQGTNAYHGLAYEYIENTNLNANTLLLNATGQPRTATKVNEFGADLGGPVKKNRLFFYGSYRGITDRYSTTVSLNLPSLAMRNGDFSALKGTQLYNPFTGAPFLNNQIPTSMFAPQAKALLQYLPAPTNSASAGLPNGAPNYIAP